MLSIIYSFAIILILFILGFGLTAFLNPFKKYSLWFIPWFTTIFLIVVCVILSFIGFSIKQMSIPLIIILLSLSIIAVIKRKSQIEFNFKEDAIMFLIIISSILFTLYPLIKLFNFPTTISLGNNDVIGYAEASDYLVLNSISNVFLTTVPFGVDNIIAGSFRWGGTILQSFFLFIFSLKGYQMTYVLHITMFAVTLPLIYLFFKKIYKQSLLGLILSLSITALNVNLLYMMYHNFFPHVIYRGITLFLLIFMFEYFYEIKNKNNQLNLYDILIALGITTLYYSYYEIIIFFLVPIGIFLIINFIKNRQLFFILLNKIIKIALITIGFCLPSIIYSLRFFLYTVSTEPGATIGWQLFRSKIPFANPFEALGFYSIHARDPLPNLFAIILSLIIIVFIIRGVIKSKYKGIIISYLIFYSFLFLKMTVIQPHFFDYNRVLVYTLPIFIITFSVGLIDWLNKRKVLTVILLAILILLELFFARKLNNRLIAERLAVDKSYISLKDINKNKVIIDKPIYTESQLIDSIPYWNEVWIGYFLNLNKPPINIVTIPKKQKPIIKDDDIIIISRAINNQSSTRILLNQIIWENQYFKIGTTCVSDECLNKKNIDLSKIKIGNNNYEDSLLISGWGKNEGDTHWANEKESTLRLITKDSYPTNLVIEALSLGKQQEMTIYIDNKLIDSVSVGTEWKTYSLPINHLLNFGVHKIKFVYSKGYRPMDVIPGNLDGRILYVNFKEIKLE